MRHLLVYNIVSLYSNIQTLYLFVMYSLAYCFFGIQTYLFFVVKRSFSLVLVQCSKTGLLSLSQQSFLHLSCVPYLSTAFFFLNFVTYFSYFFSFLAYFFDFFFVSYFVYNSFFPEIFFFVLFSKKRRSLHKKNLQLHLLPSRLSMSVGFHPAVAYSSYDY